MPKKMTDGQHPSKSDSCHNVQSSNCPSVSDPADISRTHSTIDHDVYDVSFDGDDDPMSPKGLPLARKWAIVIIVCTGTMCV